MFNRDPKMRIRNGLFFNSQSVIYSDYGVEVHIPAYESSDGPTLTIIPRWMISAREYVLGVEAALVHDYMCRNKSKYDRRISSMMLRDIWIRSGLNPIKGWIVFHFVEIYQWIMFRNEWRS